MFLIFLAFLEGVCYSSLLYYTYRIFFQKMLNSFIPLYLILRLHAPEPHFRFNQQ